MIRPAKFADTPDIEGLIRNTHSRSKYASRMAMHEKSLNSLVMGLIAGQNQNGPQASFIHVSERDGKVVGFMAGSLTRVYNVGDRFVASDVFLINEGASGSDTLRMIDAYIEWASSNPKVIEVGLSWSDAVPGSAKIRDLYRRKGFTRVGEMYELRIDVEREQEAA